MSTVVETSRLLQYGFFDCARTCCCGFARKTTFWVNIHIIAKKNSRFISPFRNNEPAFLITVEFYNFSPSSIVQNFSIPSRISLISTYSLAVCDRVVSPGPILSVGIPPSNELLDSVGEP